MPDIAAPTVCQAFLTTWVARFGAPATITTDRGRQFTSRLFADVCRFLGAEHRLTTAYHPCSNGLVERLHRQLKAALKSSTDPSHWTEHLPLVLLGIRSAVKDCGTSSAALVYGAPLRLPGEFFDPAATSTAFPDPRNFAARLSAYCTTLRPPPTRHAGTRRTFVHPDLSSATHVFVRHDGYRRPLQNPYDGPFLVESRRPKSFTLSVNGRSEIVSVDRLKPAYLDPPDSAVLTAPSAALPSPVAVQRKVPRHVHWDSHLPTIRRL